MNIGDKFNKTKFPKKTPATRTEISSDSHMSCEYNLTNFVVTYYQNSTNIVKTR